jgi:hypothetical protein
LLGDCEIGHFSELLALAGLLLRRKCRTVRRKDSSRLRWTRLAHVLGSIPDRRRESFRLPTWSTIHRTSPSYASEPDAVSCTSPSPSSLTKPFSVIQSRYLISRSYESPVAVARAVLFVAPFSLRVLTIRANTYRSGLVELGPLELRIKPPQVPEEKIQRTQTIETGLEALLAKNQDRDERYRGEVLWTRRQHRP